MTAQTIQGRPGSSTTQGWYGGAGATSRHGSMSPTPTLLRGIETFVQHARDRQLRVVFLPIAGVQPATVRVAVAAPGYFGLTECPLIARQFNSVNVWQSEVEDVGYLPSSGTVLIEVYSF